MLHPATPVSRFIGCDVGNRHRRLRFMTGRSRSIANEPQALSDFASGLEATCFVVCEATGGYEGALLAALLAAGVPVHRADARKVKAFIRSFGTIGKTDAIDARALARYGKDRCAELARWQARDAERLRLQVFVLIRRDMVRGRLAYANRRAAPCAEPAYAHLDALLESFDAQIKAVDADIAALTAQPIARAAKALVAIEGGAKTATARIALAPPPGRCPRGLAPHPKQSGETDAYRRTRDGRAEVKRVLFMAALAARKHNPTLKAFYQRLVQVGKNPSSRSPQSRENSSSSPTTNLKRPMPFK